MAAVHNGGFTILDHPPYPPVRSVRLLSISEHDIAPSWEASEVIAAVGDFSGTKMRISLVILDVVRCYLWLFTLYINIKNR